MPSTSPPTAPRHLLSLVTATWGVLFAIVHAYWAAGGEAGMNGEPADTLGAQLYIAVIAVLGLVGAGVALGLADGPHRSLTRLARLAEPRSSSAWRSAPAGGSRTGA